VSEAHQTEILELVKGSHYQIACTRYYEVTHRLDTQLPPFTQPNAYADLSMGRAPAATAPAAAPPMTTPAASA
jgi:DNA primase large subunit